MVAPSRVLNLSALSSRPEVTASAGTGAEGPPEEWLPKRTENLHDGAESCFNLSALSSRPDAAADAAASVRDDKAILYLHHLATDPILWLIGKRDHCKKRHLLTELAPDPSTPRTPSVSSFVRPRARPEQRDPHGRPGIGRRRCRLACRSRYDHRWRDRRRPVPGARHPPFLQPGWPARIAGPPRRPFSSREFRGHPLRDCLLDTSRHYILPE
jgi:hypothetical protein